MTARLAGFLALSLLVFPLLASADEAKKFNATGLIVVDSGQKVRDADAADKTRLPLNGAPTVRLLVELSSPPPGRMRILFTKEGSAFQRTVEFEPHLSSTVSRSVILPVGTWRVASWADPIRSPSDFAQDHAWVVTSCEQTKKDERNVLRCSIHGADKATGKEVAEVIISQQQRLTLSLARARLATSENSGPPLSGRAFGSVANGFVDELLSTVAEVVMERARSRASAILSKRLKEFVCEDLVLKNVPNAGNGELVCKLGSTDSSSQDPQKKTCSLQLLPATCQLVSRIRIEDLLGAGRAILSALLGDFAVLTTHGLMAGIEKGLVEELPAASEARSVLRDATQNVLAELAGQVAEIGTGRNLAGSLDAQRLLLKFAGQSWGGIRQALKASQEDKYKELRRVILALEIGFAVMEQCHELGCDARMVRRSLEQAKDSFLEEGSRPANDVALAADEVKEALALWPDLDRFVLSGLAVLIPSKAASGSIQTAAVVELVFDLLDHVAYALRDGTRPTAFDARSFQIGHASKWMQTFRAARHVLTGALKSDIQQVVASSGELLEMVLDKLAVEAQTLDTSNLRDRFAGAARFIAAGASYLSTYLPGESASAEQLKAQHQARKRAIESLIDAATDRHNRDGAWVTSLGANVGFLSGAQYRRDSDPSWGGLYPQLSLALGVAEQWLPDVRRKSKSSRLVGLHMQLSILDLAQYVAYDSDGSVSKPTWTSFFALGSQVGLLVGSASTPFMLGIDARYAPTLFPKASDQMETGGAFRIGLFAGAYIPIFDFN